MKLAFGLLVVTIPYSYSRNGSIYYQRAIPRDLQGRYAAVRVKVKLDTSDIRVAARQIGLINQQVEAEWRHLRVDGSVTPKTIREQAADLLTQWDLTPNRATNADGAESLFHAHLDTKRERYAKGDERRYAEAEGHEYLNPTEIAAAQLLGGKHTPRLSDALEVYLKVHPKRGSAQFVADTKRPFAKLIGAVGDKAIAKVERDDGHAFVTKRLATGAATGSIRRELNTIRAVFESYILERKINRKNPFSSIPIPNEGKDAKKSNPYSAKELASLAASCRAMDDEARWLIAIVSDTGARLAEIAGLTLDDIALDAATPHIVIKPHPWRSLKNRASVRSVPLVGQSLWAAKRVKNAAAEGQRFAFPRYNAAKKTNANSASAALNKWTKKVAKLNHTMHELRHTMADRLRDVECPSDVRLAIGGWTVSGVGERYGDGYTLRVLAQWLTRVVQATRV